MSKGIRVFDTILNTKNIKDTVSRNSADLWKPFCQLSGWKFSYERVHSIADLNFFFSKKIKEDVIIFSGHGDQYDGFHLSNNDCFNGANENLIKFPKKNHDKIIIFSSCLIGLNENLSKQLKAYFNAQLLFAYRHSIQDRFCFLNESILLTNIFDCIDKKSFTYNDFIKFQTNTDFMKNLNQKHVKKHPLELF